MVKTIQYLSEANTSRVLVALDLKSGLPECLADPCCTVSSRPMRTLQLSSPSGTLAPLSTGFTTILLTPTSVPTAGWIRDALSPFVVFRRPLTPVLRSVLAATCTQYDSAAKLYAYLDDWYLWIKPQYLLQALAVITVSTRSVNLALQSTKVQV